MLVECWNRLNRPLDYSLILFHVRFVYFRPIQNCITSSHQCSCSTFHGRQLRHGLTRKGSWTRAGLSPLLSTTISKANQHRYKKKTSNDSENIECEHYTIPHRDPSLQLRQFSVINTMRLEEDWNPWPSLCSYVQLCTGYPRTCDISAACNLEWSFQTNWQVIGSW